MYEKEKFMFDGLLLQELIKKENNMPLKQILGYPTAEERIEKLLEIKPYADKDAYAMYVRMVIQVDTHNVQLEDLLDVLYGLKPKDLMYKCELEEFEKLPDELTIYRGTNVFEKQPRISWSLSKDTAMRFYNGKLFTAIVDKNDVFGYFTHNCQEREILAYIKESDCTYTEF